LLWQVCVVRVWGVCLWCREGWRRWRWESVGKGWGRGGWGGVGVLGGGLVVGGVGVVGLGWCVLFVWGCLLGL